MLPVSALVLATALHAPSPPVNVTPIFRPALSALPDPVREGKSTPCLVGQLFFLTADGNFATADGDLYVTLEPTKVKAGQAPIPEVFCFDSASLAKLRTRDERLGDCYAVALPWPKDWNEVAQVRASVRFTPTAKGQSELFGTPQTLTVAPPEDAPREGAPVRCCTANFEVRAPGDKLAAQVAKEAERQRKLLAEKWLGKELPAWKERCQVEVILEPTRNTGMTAFTFGNPDGNEPGLRVMDMTLRGSAEQILSNLLPHEVTHCVLAAAVGKPVPRWMDEGIAVLAESADEQTRHDRTCREVLEDGRGLRFRHLLPMKEYPWKELPVFYAQGHTACRFLLTRKSKVQAKSPEQALTRFVTTGMESGWDEAAKAVYGFDDVSELEEAWLAWLHTPESILGAEKPKEKAKPLDDNHIPPTKLPK
jgi:hypothetical protein